MNSVFENAQWIGTDPDWAAPVITRVFSVDQVKCAMLRITGLGYFHACINGKAVTDQYFLPVISDYEPRDLSTFIYPLQDKTTNRIYYYEFDVTSLLKKGENELTIQLADGFYRQKERTAEGPTFFGDQLKALYTLSLDGETIVSDGSELHCESTTRASDLFLGEQVDLTFVPGEEKPVMLLPAPDSCLTPAIGAPDRIVNRIKPQLLGRVDNRAIFDVGVGISGLAEITTSAPAGSRIILRFADRIHEDLSLDFTSCGSSYVCSSGRNQIQQDEFITAGGTCCFMPRFVWHAFRYFEVEGEFDSVEVCEIRSDVSVNASFQSDFEGLNFLFESYLASQLSNMHGSIPSDCPHRERLGYTGDGQLCAPAAMLMLDSRAFYEKWIRDILDCQCKKSGHVQHTAPLMGGGGGPGGWGSAIITVPWAFWQRWGDKAMLEMCWEPMNRWIDYLTTRMEHGLVTSEEKDGWCLGDWCTLEKAVIPEAYVNSCYLVKTLDILESIADILGKGEQPRLAALKAETSEALRKTYLDPVTGHFADGVQGADAYAIWCGIADISLADALAAKYESMGHFDTGFLGTDILMEVLFDSGHGETVLKLLESREEGSFLWMKDHGATTLWENWTGTDSWNHPMFGGCSRHLFSGVLGIRQRPGTGGYGDIIIDPMMLPEGEVLSGTLKLGKSTLKVELDCSTQPPVATVKASLGMKVAFAENSEYLIVMEIE